MFLFEFPSYRIWEERGRRDERDEERERRMKEAVAVSLLISGWSWYIARILPV